MPAEHGIWNRILSIPEGSQPINGDDNWKDNVRKREEYNLWTCSYDPWTIWFSYGFVLEEQSACSSPWHALWYIGLDGGPQPS